MDFTHCDSFEVTIGGEPGMFEFTETTGWVRRYASARRYRAASAVELQNSAASARDAQADARAGTTSATRRYSTTTVEGDQDQLVQCARARLPSRDTAA